MHYYGYDNIKADEATRLGSGIDIYKISINLIDESIKFQSIYGSDRYLNDYINRVIKSMDKFKDMDAETIKNNIMNILYYICQLKLYMLEKLSLHIHSYLFYLYLHFLNRLT